MLHHHTWTQSLAIFCKRAGEAVLNLFRLDMTETKWGHRVMDQIFREGKFSAQENNKPGNPGRRD